MHNISIFNGNASQKLASQIANILDIKLGNAHVDKFSDGETIVEILDNVRRKNVFIIQSTSKPANDHIMELLTMADALRRASAKTITAVIPYFGYARQDRRVRSARVPITAKIIADTFNCVGIDRVVTVELHADQIQGFFKIPVDNVYSTCIMLDDLENQNIRNPLIVSPDIGGVLRARAMAKRLNDTELAIIDKRRFEKNKTEIMHIIGNVRNKDCIIIDDIVDTAGTLCKAAESLHEHGATSVRAYITHPVLSGSALNTINNSILNELVVCDSIQLSPAIQQSKKIRQISLSSMLAETIKRINSGKSVSSMFKE